MLLFLDNVMRKRNSKNKLKEQNYLNEKVNENNMQHKFESSDQENYK